MDNAKVLGLEICPVIHLSTCLSIVFDVVCIQIDICNCSCSLPVLLVHRFVCQVLFLRSSLTVAK